MGPPGWLSPWFFMDNKFTFHYKSAQCTVQAVRTGLCRCMCCKARAYTHKCHLSDVCSKDWGTEMNHWAYSTELSWGLCQSGKPQGSLQPSIKFGAVDSECRPAAMPRQHCLPAQPVMQDWACKAQAIYAYWRLWLVRVCKFDIEKWSSY
eukprot:1160702-Pelagomonas_calceolata.AAC.7